MYTQTKFAFFLSFFFFCSARRQTQRGGDLSQAPCFCLLPKQHINHPDNVTELQTAAFCLEKCTIISEILVSGNHSHCCGVFLKSDIVRRISPLETNDGDQGFVWRICKIFPADELRKTVVLRPPPHLTWMNLVLWYRQVLVLFKAATFIVLIDFWHFSPWPHHH